MSLPVQDDFDPRKWSRTASRRCCGVRLRYQGSHRSHVERYTRQTWIERTPARSSVVGTSTTAGSVSASDRQTLNTTRQNTEAIRRKRRRDVRNATTFGATLVGRHPPPTTGRDNCEGTDLLKQQGCAVVVYGCSGTIRPLRGVRKKLVRVIRSSRGTRSANQRSKSHVKVGPSPWKQTCG